MEVVSHCAFPVAGRVFRPRGAAPVLAFAAKATFTLAPGKLALAADQQPVHEFDRPWSESVTSLYAAADLVPRKLRADVVLIGNAYAPGGTPAQKVVARVIVGDVDKSIEVWCDRTQRADGSVVDGRYFTTLPLLYERAAGGPGTDNPVGLPADRDAYGSVALPNLTPLGARLAPDSPIAPIGFGPIAARWPTRMARLGRYGDDFAADAWHDKALPPDFDMGYFNVAPADQQPSQIRPDERIVLENLNREHAKLVMTLPGVRLRAKASGPGGDRAVVMTCDTLWIDTSGGVCCVTYRGQVTLGSPTEAGWVVVTVDPDEPEEPKKSRRHDTLTGAVTPADIVKAAPRAPTPEPQTASPQTLHPQTVRPRPSANTLPFLSDAALSPGPDVRIGGPPAGVTSLSSTRSGLPFQSAPDSLRRADSAVPFRRDGAPPPAPLPPQTPGLPPGWSAPTKPPAPLSTSMPVAHPPTAPPPPLAGAPQPPAMPPPVPLPAAVQPGLVQASLIQPAPVPPGPVQPGPVQQPPLQPPRFTPPAAVGDSPWALTPSAPAGTIAPVGAAAVAAVAPGDFRNGGGALLASNAAAGTNEARSAPRAADPSRPLVIPVVAARPLLRESTDALELVFFDPDSLPRIRRVAPWKKILVELVDKPIDAEEDDPAEAKEPSAVEDRREIIEILLRAEPGATDALSIDEALRRAVRDDGRYLAPLLVVSGELSTPFDEVETLKATLTTVTPLAGGDENLRAAVEIAKDFLKLPGLNSSPAVAEGLTNRVRDAFNGAKRAVQPGYLDAQTERALVEQRFYQHRLVLGGRRQRALFQLASSDGSGRGTGTPLVAYLPESAAAKLPLFARFKVRLIARLHLPLDQYDQGPALEALAMARLCPSPRRDQK